MMRNKRLLKAIKPYALERLYLVNSLYESNKITKEEYITVIKLIYKSGGLQTGEQYFLKFVLGRPVQLSNSIETISDILFACYFSLKKRALRFVHRITGRESYKEKFMRKHKIKTEEDLCRYVKSRTPVDLSLFTAPLPSTNSDN